MVTASTKRARRADAAPPRRTADEIHDALPCLTGLPDSATDETRRAIMEKFFDPDAKPRRFRYASIIKQYGSVPNDAILALRTVGAFSSHVGRQALIELVGEARGDREHGAECEDETLDKIERYAKYAYSIEADETTVGCGTVAAAFEE